MSYAKLARNGVSTLALGIYLAATPVSLDFGSAEHGFLGLAASQAFAKDRGNDRDDRGGRSERSGRDDGGDRGGRSERSGNSDRDHADKARSSRDDAADKARSARDDDNDDRSSGSGRDDRDDDYDDRSGRSAGSDDDYEDDDRRGRGQGSDDRTAGGGATAAGNGSASGGLRVVKVEESGTGLEVVYSNGIKEEIEGGRYELKNASGRTVVERTATGADLARMQGNARNSGVLTTTGVVSAGRSLPRVPSGSQVRKVEVGSRSIEVNYTTGWREQVERNRYELKDPNNNTVVERRATQADVDRLMALTR